jgi:hypothetical protein
MMAALLVSSAELTKVPMMTVRLSLIYALSAQKEPIT